MYTYRPGMCNAISLTVFAWWALQLRSHMPSTTKRDVHRRACTQIQCRLELKSKHAPTPNLRTAFLFWLYLYCRLPRKARPP